MVVRAAEAMAEVVKVVWATAVVVVRAVEAMAEAVKVVGATVVVVRAAEATAVGWRCTFQGSA